MKDRISKSTDNSLCKWKEIIDEHDLLVKDTPLEYRQALNDSHYRKIIADKKHYAFNYVSNIMNSRKAIMDEYNRRFGVNA